MQNFSDESALPIKTIDFRNIPVDTVAEKNISIENKSEKTLTYRVSLMYALNSIDHVFKLSITSTPVKPTDCAEVRILFRPNITGQSFTDYYVIDDTDGNIYRLTVTGKCYGPEVILNKKKLMFRICKNVSEHRRAVVKIINKSAVDTTYQWLLPIYGQGYFQISTGNCGLIRAFETITTTVLFTGTALGAYIAEMVCLVLNQEPLFLNVLATVVLPGNPLSNINDHVFEMNWKRKSRYMHLMENSLKRLIYIPSASVFERYLDFGTGSISDITLNISQTLSVTNHEQEEGCIQWMADPDNIFLIDPIDSVIPPNESRLFTIRFRNFVVMPMCGIVQSRGWQIISVALEPKSCGNYYETWDLIINKVHKARICLSGNAEVSQVELMSHGYNPSTHAVYEFPPTITDCTNYCTAYLHNLTRMNLHIRVLNSVPWLGADNSGTIVLPPKEIIKYHWWFFPKTPNKVYETTVTFSCICLINNKPVGEPTEIFIHIKGFSELPDLRVIPKTINLHDIVVGDSLPFNVTLYNYGSCFFTSRLFHTIDGMGDDFSADRLEINSTVNSLKPSSRCEVAMTVIPAGAGPRQIDIKYTVLFRTEYEEIDEIQPIQKTICTIWYDGIYPTIKVKRTISVKCPVILSNHCVWNIFNVNELNKALMDCRPNKPMSVNIYAPDLCVRNENVEFIFVLGCVYNVPVPWNLRREKICDCEMIQVQIGISTYEMRHTCTHRSLVELSPLSGIVTIVWLYNPTVVFTTWRLLKGNTISPDSVIRCLLYFAEVPPLGKLAIPFAFMPTEMVDYEVTFYCSFGYDTVKILVRGQGGLPNCVETRLDIPSYVEKVIRNAYRNDVIYLSVEHITIPIMPTHSLSRDILSICNDTDRVMRFIWLPERIANIVNIVMTPCWGVIQPKCTEWITMTVYTLQEPATFTTTVACEILDLTERKRYQRNESLRRNKIEKCNQEFIITEHGTLHPDINDSPPYVLDIEKPQPFYLAMSVSISSKGQRDGYPRMLLKQMWEQTPPYDLLSSDLNDHGNGDKITSGNNMTMTDIIRVIDGILWDALHSKMFRNQIEFYAKEEIPTYSQLVKIIDADVKPRLSRRVTSGICDAIVNKAVFHIYGLNPKHEVSIMDAE
ncbi:uncharacterized protein LOC113517617 isoform X3 [Galleria mellonella]|uniref:Uncharacterized protein LOC113517617 isoform X3 n=1 Tax=Galleria mellonella TaxID=7137 RepID=A0ABM3N1H8_GALME|nr:uncharacterized protein LOC113517617 isoform X3 [Galleria mellonella]